MAGAENDAFGHSHHGSDCLRLRHVGISFTPQRSILVSGVGGRYGNGLALFRHHYIRDGRIEARTRSEIQRAGLIRVWRAGQVLAEYARRVAGSLSSPWF